MMHKDELPIDAASIRELLLEQAPQWACLPLDRVVSSGTDNALFRLGESLILRLPRREEASLFLTKELDWLPIAGPACPFRSKLL